MNDTPAHEPLTKFKPGEMLFKVGDPGGDLFLIHKGTVEIFVGKDDAKVELTKMGPGEIIGVATCMTSAPRMASAQALTEVEAQVVKQEKLAKLFKTMPAWMQTIVNDLVRRIEHVNESYAEAIHALEELQRQVPTRLDIALKLAAELATATEKPECDVKQEVSLSGILSMLKGDFDCELDELERTVRVFYRTGVVKSELKGKYRQAKLRDFRDLRGFIDYVHLRQKRAARYRQRHLSFKELGELNELVAYVEQKFHDTGAKVQVPLDTIVGDLITKSGKHLSPATVAIAADLGILTLQGAKGREVASFVPETLARFIKYEMALRRFQITAGPEPEKPGMTLKVAV